MIEEDIAFVVISALTIGAAIVSLESKNIIYGAIGLAFSFLGLAGLFIVLDATFVALFQIIVNIGAVAVLILFTVMLVGEGRFLKELSFPAARVAGIAAACILALTLALSFISSRLAGSAPQASAPNFLGIGIFITSQFAFALEVLALVFGGALLGALTLAKLDKE
jgi:NADH-quinone oxidoreductase subunit J